MRDAEREALAIPPIRFAPARGARLAYQVFGEGPPTVVAIPPTAQNIEVAWEWPDIRRMLERFGSFCRYLHFDKRSTGCSDRRSQVPGMDERVDDLRAVMDDAGIDHAFLFGSSEGGPMTLLFAATYPERVDGIVLFGSGGLTLPRDLDDDEVDVQRELHRNFASRWGTPDSPAARGLAPTIAERDPSFVAWHQRYERVAATRDSLEDLLELTLGMDVREVMPDIATPTLIIHRTRDRVVPIARGREAAKLLPNARLLEQDGDDHVAYAGDVDGWMDEFERFVTGTVRSAPVASRARPRARIRSLGRFAVEVDGEEVPVAAWGSRQARLLLKRLVAARGWPVTRDELFDMLWPDETRPDRLGARLSVQLSAVRRVLRGGVIADRETVRLDLDEVATDLEDFHRADTDDAIVAAYDGELLPEDRFESWTDAPRAAAAARFAGSARRLAETALRSGEPEHAVELVERLLELDRYDETAHRIRVEAWLAAGAPGKARSAHEEWTAAVAEIGVTPPPLETAGTER